jgi:hypothetical protein
MAWSAIQTATQLTSLVDTEQYFDLLIGPLNPGESAEVHIEGNPPASPTDDLQINLYGALEDTSENWDDTPFQSLIVPNTPDPSKISFTVYGRYKVRVGAVVLVGSETWTADMEIRRDGVSV